MRNYTLEKLKAKIQPCCQGFITWDHVNIQYHSHIWMRRHIKIGSPKSPNCCIWEGEGSSTGELGHELDWDSAFMPTWVGMGQPDMSPVQAESLGTQRICHGLCILSAHLAKKTAGRSYAKSTLCVACIASGKVLQLCLWAMRNSWILQF